MTYDRRRRLRSQHQHDNGSDATSDPLIDRGLEDETRIVRLSHIWRILSDQNKGTGNLFAEFAEQVTLRIYTDERRKVIIERKETVDGVCTTAGITLEYDETWHIQARQ